MYKQFDMARKGIRRNALAAEDPSALIFNVRRSGARFGKNHRYMKPRQPEAFDYKKALRELRGDITRLKQKNIFVFNRLEHALELVRKQRKRHTELLEGKTPLRADDGCVIRYKFICNACGSRFATFHDLSSHKHKRKPVEKPTGKPKYSGKPAGGIQAEMSDTRMVDDESFDLEDLDAVLDMDFDELSL